MKLDVVSDGCCLAIIHMILTFLSLIFFLPVEIEIKLTLLPPIVYAIFFIEKQ